MRALALLAVATAAGGVDASEFRWTRIVHQGGSAPVEIEPDGGLFEHARVGFADLRVVDANGDQVPWRALPPPRTGGLQHVRALNSGRQAAWAVALLDLGPRRAARDRIRLDVPDRDFVGRVIVSGADRRGGPFTQLSATGIYDVRGARRARSTTAVFPPTDFRYVLVRARGVSLIRGAAVSGTAGRPRTIQRPHEVTTRQAGRRTIVTLDFGFRNVPVDELRVTAATARFDRVAIVDASNSGRLWRSVTYARISRFEGSSPAPLVVGTRARYVRLSLDNGDDPPLTGVRISASSRSHALLLEGGHEPPYRLLYGNAGLGQPDYEFARLPVDSRQLPIAGTFGDEEVNPAFDVPERPFGERHGWILPAALALAAAAVALAGFLALRRGA